MTYLTNFNQLTLGETGNAVLEFNTSQAPDSLLLGVDNTSHIFHFCEKADKDYDWIGVGALSFDHPTIVFHTTNQVRNEYTFVGMSDTTKFRIAASDGDLIDGTTQTRQGVDIEITSGYGGTLGAGSRSGHISLVTTDAGGTNANSGDLEISLGNKTGTGRNGMIVGPNSSNWNSGFVPFAQELRVYEANNYTGYMSLAPTTTSGAFTTSHAQYTFTGTAKSTGLPVFMTFTPPNNTGLTALNSAPQFIFASSTQTWDGSIGVLNAAFYVEFQSPTYAYSAAQIIADATNVNIAEPTAGANATLTRKFALKTGNIWMNGSQRVKTTTVNVSSYTVLLDDYILHVTYTGTGACTVNLPAAATAAAGRLYIIKDAGGNAGTNNITIDGSGSETIDGATTKVISANYGTAAIYCDGTNWFTIYF